MGQAGLEFGNDTPRPLGVNYNIQLGAKSTARGVFRDHVPLSSREVPPRVSFRLSHASNIAFYFGRVPQKVPA